jgi:hypothetical protein
MPTVLKCQNDSVEIHRMGDNYIEIKILRYKLDSNCVSDRGEVTVKSFIPEPVKLKNGTVFIKDRLNRTLATYFYSDSIVVTEEFYDRTGRMTGQKIHSKDGSYDIERWYWGNGNLYRMRYLGNGLDERYFFSEDGKMIERKK